jgi:hypothetical protein
MPFIKNNNIIFSSNISANNINANSTIANNINANSTISQGITVFSDTTSNNFYANTYNFVSQTLGTATAGRFEFNGIAPYFTPAGSSRGVVPGMQYYALTSAYVGINSTGAQSLFGTANGVNLTSNTVYQFDCSLYMTKSSGTTSHSISLLFGGTATVNSIMYQGVENQSGGGLSGPQATPVSFISTSTSGNQTTSATGNAVEYIQIAFKGVVSINVGGTFNPQYSLSAAPGGAYTTQPGSYFAIYPVGVSGNNTTIGSWS